MTPMTRLAAALAGLALVTAPTPLIAQSQNGSAGGNRSGILHTAAVGAYDHWLGQSGRLDGGKWGYGATVRYFAGGAPFGIGFNWMRNKLDVSGSYRAQGHTFNDTLTMDRLGADLYYPLEPNSRGNLPYLLAGGGRLTTEGKTAGGATEEESGTFWEAGLGIINGGSNYTAFALELKYIGTLNEKVRSDDGIIELSMSIGYNW